MFIIIMLLLGVVSAQPPLSGLEDLTALLITSQGIARGRDPSWASSTPPCQWVGIECDNSAQRVVRIIWDDMGLTGTVNLTALPSELKSFNVFENSLTGEVDLVHLPRNMTELVLQYNAWTGPLVLTFPQHWRS